MTRDPAVGQVFPYLTHLTHLTHLTGKPVSMAVLYA